jgi:hypothetical protein
MHPSFDFALQTDQGCNAVALQRELVHNFSFALGDDILATRR